MYNLQPIFNRIDKSILKLLQKIIIFKVNSFFEIVGLKCNYVFITLAIIII